MATISLQVDKASVWSEVAKTSGYTGDKMSGDDDGAYDRILLTDEDEKSLQRFWEEAVSVANEQLKEMLEHVSPIASDYEVSLRVSNSYDHVLNDSVRSSLTSYFILAICGRWYKFCNKGESESYLRDSMNMMAEVQRKLYWRKRPARPKRESK